jgi:Na+-transporting NADH:ubiquinone oxidoreductase subunit F
MLTVILGVAAFVLVIVSLVVVLIIAKSKLVAAGDVTVTVNDDPDKAIVTAAGDTLLNTLAAQKIFIPSACGGKGTCGVCKVEVHSGGGALLPTETSHVSRGEARNGVRLSCQVKVKQDMEIEVEPEIEGQAGYGDRGRTRDLQRPQVALQRAIEPQRRHFHQGTGSRAAGG